jgi:hypothetical protein
MGPAVLDAANGFLHDAVFVVGLCAGRILGDWNPEEDQAFQARIHGPGHLVHELVQAELELAGHGGDGFAEVRVGFDHEIRLDQVVPAKPAFADQVAHCRR